MCRQDMYESYQGTVTSLKEVDLDNSILIYIPPKAE